MDKGLKVGLNITTYADLRAAGEEIYRFVENAYRIILNELVRKPDRVILGTRPVESHRNRRFVFNQKNQLRLKEELLQGALQSITVTAEFNRPPEEDPPSPYAATITMDIFELLRLDEPGIASTVELSIPRFLFGNRPATDWQSMWVELGSGTFQELEAATGYLTLDYFSPGGLNTIFENQFARPWTDVGRSFRTKLRGYYWGNWLSKGHIVQLGGPENIRQEAPCHAVKAVGKNDTDRLFLQLTPDLDNYSDEALRGLWVFLNPLLPVGKRVGGVSWKTVGYRLVDET